MASNTIPDFLLTRQYIADNISPNNDSFTRNKQKIDRIPPLALDNIITWNSDVFQDISSRIDAINLDKIGVEGTAGQLLGFSSDNVLAAFNLQDLVTSQGPLILDGSQVLDNTLYGNALRTHSIPQGKLGPQSIVEQNHSDLSVSTRALQDGSGTESKYGDLSVSTRALQDGSGTESKHGNLSVSTRVVQTGAITTDKVGAGAIILSKLADEVLQFLIPTGTILAYGGSAAPAGFVLCSGGLVNRIGPGAPLFAVIGTRFGAGDGSTNFNLPDLRGRIPAGSINNNTNGRITNATASTTNIGGVGGSEQVTLDITQIPSHHHSVLTYPNFTTYFVSSGPSATAFVLQAGVDTNTTDVGGGQAHNNMPPFLLVNYIIKY